MSYIYLILCFYCKHQFSSKKGLSKINIKKNQFSGLFSIEPRRPMHACCMQQISVGLFLHPISFGSVKGRNRTEKRQISPLLNPSSCNPEMLSNVCDDMKGKRTRDCFYSLPSFDTVISVRSLSFKKTLSRKLEIRSWN